VARGWTGVEFIDKGVSGGKDRRPALDKMVTDAKRRRFDVVVCWRLDRLGRSLKHLISLLDDLQALGVAFVSLAEGIDATTPDGKLQMHILGAIAEFERGRLRERVLAGLARARRAGKRLGRPDVRSAKRGSPRFVGCLFAKPLGGWASRPLLPIAGCLRNPPQNPPPQLSKILGKRNPCPEGSVSHQTLVFRNA
jgi:DNA invertase Pin-like site-specific DNA recombinase